MLGIIISGARSIFMVLGLTQVKVSVAFLENKLLYGSSAHIY